MKVRVPRCAALRLPPLGWQPRQPALTALRPARLSAQIVDKINAKVAKGEVRLCGVAAVRRGR
jgi:hypothetical protein